MKDQPKMTHSLFILFFVFGAIIPTFNAHIGDFDAVWRRRAEEARKFALQTYESEPTNVTLAFNKKTREYVKFLSFSLFRAFSSFYVQQVKIVWKIGK